VRDVLRPEVSRLMHVLALFSHVLNLITHGFDCIFSGDKLKTLKKNKIHLALKKSPDSFILKAVATNEKPIIAIGYFYNEKTLFL
jgi:hypothetical protein